MKRHTCFVLVLITATFPVCVSGYANGQVSSSCASMLPSHLAHAQQTSDPPYQVTANSSSFNPGDIIQVTLQGKSGTSFTGFLLEARAAEPSSSGIPLGTFRLTSSDAQLLDCNIGGVNYKSSAVSHTSKKLKSEVTVNWIASDTGNIQFRGTFVQNFTTFWTQVKSQILQRSVDSVSPTTSNSNTVTSVSPTKTSLLNTQSQGIQISSDGCGTTKFCFRTPSQCNPATESRCHFMSSTPLDNRGLQFELSGKAPGYISIGFSDDKIMGNDDVYICGMDSSGNIQVQHAYNTGKVLPRTEPLGEVDNIHVANVNGIIQCSFNTRNNISVVPRAANDQYYLFFAYGPSDNGQILKHPKIPYISEEKANIRDIQSVSGYREKSILVKTHAALTLIAWMTTASIGMIIAKFFKCAGGNKKILGKNIWFQLHLFLMVLTVAATIIGFVLVFVDKKHWSHHSGTHPILGCVVMGLTLIQPIVAICRPAPDHKRAGILPACLPRFWGVDSAQRIAFSLGVGQDHMNLRQMCRRFIFNWFHSFMGLTIKCLAVATLFLGFNLINMTENRWPTKVLGGFVGWEALIYITLSVSCCFKEKAFYVNLKKKMEPYLLIFIVYLFGNVAFLIALLVAIGQS